DAWVDGAPIWNSGIYQSVEDSSPIDPADETGGYGQITLPIRDHSGVKRMGGKTLLLKDGAMGQTVGVIRGRSGDGLTANLVADSRLSQLAVTRQAAPFHGFLDDALLYYLSLCGITSGIVIDDSFETVEVALPGWEANVFDQISKKMAPAYG